MKRQLLALSRRYQAALRRHLQQGPGSRVPRTPRLGQTVVTLGLKTPDLAWIHKTAMSALTRAGDSSAAQGRMIKRAGIFFAEAFTLNGKTPRAGKESAAHLNRKDKTLTQRTAQLVAANRHLKQGILQRKAAEETLRNSGRHNAKLLRGSHQLQKNLRDLIHQLLSAQEAQRKKMSHELQDEVAQTLLGINVRLLTLKKAATGGTAGLRKEIASTQRLVEKSVQSINRFARELDIHQPA